MDATWFLLLSVLIYGFAACAGLLFHGKQGNVRLFSGILGLLAAVAAVVCAGLGLFYANPAVRNLFSMGALGWFGVNVDALAAFLVGLIGLVGAGVSLYSLSGREEAGFQAFFINLFLGAMLLVVTVTNAFFFLLFWELMTLASYFLVIWEIRNPNSIRSGYIYMLVAHAGAALILLGFLLLFQQTGSLEFRIWRQAWLEPGLKSVVFLLVFLGFGAKAGMVPLHFWAPGAYAAAPSQASALMAGVMKKVALYGLLRLSVDLLGASSWWWGAVVLLFGALSTAIGAFYALTESDLKRLLAYSSVENVGIILLGIGVGMLGLSVQQPGVAVLGFLAAMYHMLNHAFFKSLLFLGAGKVFLQVGVHDLNRIGGLSRRMPWTALTFLVGALAATAIPPFNGFVSEWFTYHSLFSASQASFFFMRVFAPLCAVVLALAGALAVMVYLKAYGSVFSGPARSPAAEQATETRGASLLSLIYLAAGCLVLGLGAPWVAPWIANAAAQFSRSPRLEVSNGWQNFPGNAFQAVLSTPLIVILLLSLLVVPFLLVLIWRGRRVPRRTGVEPWSCGYGYSPPMSMPASGFDQPVRVTFNALYWLRSLADAPMRLVADAGLAAKQRIIRFEPQIEKAVTRPIIRLVETTGQWIQALQMGDIRIYCLYIILTLTILLIVIFGGGAL